MAKRLQEESYVCVEPEAGEDLLLDYESGYLDETRLHIFEVHLEACLACQESRKAFSRMAKVLKATEDFLRPLD